MANQQVGSSSSNVQQQASWCYMNKLIASLIEMFENNLDEEGNSAQTFCSEMIFIQAYEVLINYLESYYTSTVYLQQTQIDQQSMSLSPQMQQIQQINIKLQNYHSNIRRDIFEFLIRIRSDCYKRLILLSRTNRRKYTKSKYLVLTVFTEETKRDNFVHNNQLNYSRILKLFELCLDQVRIR
jgi:hypothetical protein